MGMSIMCVHCKTVNPLPRDGAVYCSKCLHRCDVPPEECNCLMCAGATLPDIPSPWSDQQLPDLPPIPVPCSLEGVSEEVIIYVDEDGLKISIKYGSGLFDIAEGRYTRDRLAGLMNNAVWFLDQDEKLDLLKLLMKKM